MSYLDLQLFSTSTVLYIAPSGIQLFLSENQFNLLGKNANSLRISETLNTHSFALIVIHVDSYCLDCLSPDLFENYKNLVMILGDTHHGKEPLSKLIKWLLSSNVQRIANYSCPHHDEIITKLTGIECIYFPIIFAVKFWIYPKITSSDQNIIHLGSISKNHERRKYVMKSLVNKMVPIQFVKLFGFKMNLALNYSAAVINCSLNNDISHRISETMSAGTLVFTDKLTQHQRFLSILENENIIETYDISSIDKFADHLNYFKNNYLKTTSGLEDSYKKKINRQNKFRSLIRELDLYRVLKKFLFLEEVILPNALIPLSTQLKPKYIEEHLTDYEEKMETHRQLIAKNNNKLLISQINSNRLLLRLADYYTVLNESGQKYQ